MRHTRFRVSGGMSAPLFSSMVVEPLSSVIMPLSTPGLVPELASSVPGTNCQILFLEVPKKLSLSCFLESFCINSGSMANANWTLGAFGKSGKFAHVYLSLTFDLGFLGGNCWPLFTLKLSNSQI